MPVGLAFVALSSLAAAYSLTHYGPGTPGSAPIVPVAVALRGFYPAAAGPERLHGQWLAGAGEIDLSGHGRYWLAVEAAGNGRTRTVDLSGPGGERAGFLAFPVPRPTVVGPLMLDGHTSLEVAVHPPGQASAHAGRALGVFLASPTLSPSPLAALPGEGFFQTETAPDGSPFNWLDQKARIDVASADPATRSAWISFSATPIDAGRGKLLVATSGRSIAAFPSLTGSVIVAGPVRLVDGRGSVVLSVAHRGPLTSGDRYLTFRVARIRALDRAPPGAGG